MKTRDGFILSLNRVGPGRRMILKKKSCSGFNWKGQHVSQVDY
ncbi:MAG: hypothetical protein HY203_07910 [Nitrospirae bacterium]|nr:hypothetical protein [Nitrospirota bacterium]